MMLLIDDSVRLRVQEIKERAKGLVFTMDDLLDVSNEALLPAGDDDNLSIYIPNGYKVVYSLEQQPMGLCQHISVSLEKANSLSSIVAFNEILNLFEFHGRVGNIDIKIWIEELGNGRQAINAIELVDK